MYVTSCTSITLFFTDWFENINILYNKIDMYVKHNFDAESFYVGTTIRELCEARDNCSPQFFDRGGFWVRG